MRNSDGAKRCRADARARPSNDDDRLRAWIVESYANDELKSNESARVRQASGTELAPVAAAAPEMNSARR